MVSLDRKETDALAFHIEYGLVLITVRLQYAPSNPAVLGSLQGFLNMCQSCNGSTRGIIISVIGSQSQAWAMSTEKDWCLSEVSFQLHRCGCPIIGFATGLSSNVGIGILAACDVVFADHHSSFGFRMDSLTPSLVPLLQDRTGMDGVSAWFFEKYTMSAYEAANCKLVTEILFGEQAMHSTHAKIRHSLSGCASQGAAGVSLPTSLEAPGPRAPAPESSLYASGHPCPKPYSPPQMSSAPVPNSLEQSGLERPQSPGFVSHAALAPPSLECLGAQEPQKPRQPITTLMVRNLPGFVTPELLAQILDSLGLEDKYDYLHIPSSGKPSSMKATSLGYGFVNFPDEHDAAAFLLAFTGRSFAGDDSGKTCCVHPASFQGIQANLNHICRHPYLHESRRPMIRELPGTPSTSDYGSESGGQHSSSASSSSSMARSDGSLEDGRRSPLPDRQFLRHPVRPPTCAASITRASF